MAEAEMEGDFKDEKPDASVTTTVPPPYIINGQTVH
jgi:hypothetical protein